MWLFLGEGLKSNTHLFWAVVTGVFWVADGGLFPSLDNLGVYTLLTREFNDCFGFTEPEVAALLERHGQRYKLEGVRSWCNGYLFGGLAVYYPSSVLCFLERGDETPRPWWLSTSSNDLVDELLERHALRLQPVFEILLEGGSVERTLDENVVLSEARNDEDTLFCLLVFSGYLSAEAAPVDELGHSIYRLSIPNREVREVYATTFRRWMTALRRGFIERPTAGWTAHPPSGSARA